LVPLNSSNPNRKDKQEQKRTCLHPKGKKKKKSEGQERGGEVYKTKTTWKSPKKAGERRFKGKIKPSTRGAKKILARKRETTTLFLIKLGKKRIAKERGQEDTRHPPQSGGGSGRNLSAP